MDFDDAVRIEHEKLARGPQPKYVPAPPEWLGRVVAAFEASSLKAVPIYNTERNRREKRGLGTIHEDHKWEQVGVAWVLTVRNEIGTSSYAIGREVVASASHYPRPPRSRFEGVRTVRSHRQGVPKAGGWTYDRRQQFSTSPGMHFAVGLVANLEANPGAFTTSSFGSYMYEPPLV